MAIILFRSQSVKDKLWCPVAPLGGVSIHLANSPNEFSWNIIFPDISNTLIVWHTLYSKVNDGSVSVMLNPHLISIWKLSTYGTLWTHYPQFCNLTKTHLRSSPSEVRHPTGFQTLYIYLIQVVIMIHRNATLRLRALDIVAAIRQNVLFKWTPCALYT